MADLQPTAHDKAPQMPWGLHLIGDATSEARQGGVAVDIIAVHGLGANPDHAWVRHKDVTAGLEKDVRWLTDLLPQTFRDYQPSISARVFCFNYQSAWLGSQLSRNRLEGLAGRLLDDINNMRATNSASSDRPLIFIGHSFGGLVIEQAVVQANSAGSMYQYLVELIGGVVLLGTPHQGSKSQTWGSILANLAKLIDYGETGLMKEVDEKSMKIFDLISGFKKIMISMDLAKTAVICFYENSPTNYLSRVIKTGPWIQTQTSSMVVEETSAVLSGFYSIVLDSDHLKLNKFANSHDGNYVSVSSNICRIAAEAPELIRRRRKETVSSHFLVSRERVKDFIGRDGLLDQIRSHFSRVQTGPPAVLILHALGGQGKSQIALEYCRKWRETYHGVFWIDANSEMTATRSYAMIVAELMGESWNETGDSAARIRLVKDRLEQWSEEWLLVFDNYDEPDTFSEIRRFIPIRGHGHVIVTSRHQDLSRLGTLLKIPPMATEEGVKLLLRGYNDNEIQQVHKDTASSIIDRLGRLALAIDQAAAYIKYKRIPLDRLGDFLTTYEAERRRILSYTPKKFWEYRKLQNQGQAEHISAFTTWEMSFQQLGSGHEPWEKDAAHFLTLSAFFAPTSITESLFRYYQEMYGREVEWIQIFSLANDVEEDGDDDDDVDKEDDKAGSQSSGRGFHGTWDPDRFWDVIANSEELSLLQSISPGTGQEGASFSLHPLIRDWLQLRLKANERQKYTQEAILVLARCVQAYKTRSTTLEEKTALITHMDVSVSNDEEFSEPQDRLGRKITSCDMASWFAKFYIERGQYRTSEYLYRRVVETDKSVLSEKHPDTLRSMNNLAELLIDQGKYEEAESMHRQTLMLTEMELGKKHPDTLTSINNLAELLRYQGKLEEAESMHRQTLTLTEMDLGKKHPSTLNSMNNLAELLGYQGKYDEAESMHRQTLMLTEMELGKKHPDTLNSMNNLAELLRHQGKYEEAESMHRQTLMLRETKLGKNHPNTLRSMNNLAGLLMDQGKYEEAESMYRQTLMLRETELGKNHPGTLTSINNLAELLRYQGKYGEAESMHRQTLTLKEMELGKNHPGTLISMNNLAVVLHDQNKHEESERLFRQTLMLRETVLGKENPNTLESLENLAKSLRKQGKHEEAERISPGNASSRAMDDREEGGEEGEGEEGEEGSEDGEMGEEENAMKSLQLASE